MKSQLSGPNIDQLQVGESEAAPLQSRRRRISIAVARAGSLWTLAILVLEVAAFALIGQNFISQANWLATSVYATEFLLLALGETFVIMTAGIDLSDGAVLGLSGMVAALVMSSLVGTHLSSPIVVAIGVLAGLACGTSCGLINGLAITRLDIPPFVATLGMLGIATGATDLIHNGAEITNVPTLVGTIGNTVILDGWVPVPVLITAVCCFVAWFWLSRTRFGLRTHAIGSRQIAARRAGIGVDAHLVRVYMISGLFASIAGVLVLARFSSASPLAGANDELYAIAAVMVGGASLMGRRGSIQGTIMGSLVISIMVTGLVLANVEPFWQEVAVGVILMTAVYFDKVRNVLIGL